MSTDGAYIGIDLGTTFNCVALCKGQGQQLEVLTDRKNNRVFPSVVTCLNGTITTGTDAVPNSKKAGASHLKLLKRITGRTTHDADLLDDLKALKHKFILVPVAEDPTCEKIADISTHSGPLRPLFKLGGKYITVEEYFAHQLRGLEQVASTRLGQPIAGAVITVPADYNVVQRDVVITAAKIAGLSVLRLINEPTAAIIGCKAAGHIEKDGEVLVLDVGGGTTDVSLVTVDSSIGQQTYCVQATKGDHWVGGEDVTVSLMKFIRQQLAVKEFGAGRDRFRTDCNIIKQQMGDDETLILDTEFLQRHFPSAEFDEEVEIPRAEFDEFCAPLYDRVYDLVEQVLELSDTAAKDLVAVLLVGGSAGLFGLRNFLQKKLPGADFHVPPGYEEAIAKGAAVLAASEAGSGEKIIVTDVLAHSVGLEVEGRFFSSLVKAGTALTGEISGENTYSNKSDNQEVMTLRFYEGDSPYTSENTYLGKFNLKVTPMPAGQNKVKVNCTVYRQGTIAVTAQEQIEGGVPTSIQITRAEEWSEAVLSRLSARVRPAGQVDGGKAPSENVKRKCSDGSEKQSGNLKRKCSNDSEKAN